MSWGTKLETAFWVVVCGYAVWRYAGTAPDWVFYASLAAVAVYNIRLNFEHKRPNR